ncbi:hypothetical protein U8P73_36210 (plasmid) [Rhizobium beringeri]|uniref:hypothetical protein n=1 Tax=Rhizobium beringeri TaxID=3019934 RepID=UPI002DDD7A88|nr:hypothetical protein [Rhizobium beringeri]WSG93595.1 hypothetical protein U8P73_36210 [Rhizobium beringeri]
MNGKNEIQMAKAFAAGAPRRDQAGSKSYTGEPYIVHPAAVAGIVEAVPTHTWQMLCMAWLHDTVEDTGVTHGMILDLFGEEVRQGVWYRPMSSGAPATGLPASGSTCSAWLMRRIT